MKTQKELIDIFSNKYSGQNFFDMVDSVSEKDGVFELPDGQKIKIESDNYVDFIYAVDGNGDNPIYVGYVEFDYRGRTIGFVATTDKPRKARIMYSTD